MIANEEAAVSLHIILQEGFVNYTKQQKVNSRPSKYQKIGSTCRTTLQSRQVKVNKATAHLRAQGYHDLRTLWQSPQTLEVEDVITSKLDIQANWHFTIPEDTMKPDGPGLDHALAALEHSSNTLNIHPMSPLSSSSPSASPSGTGCTPSSVINPSIVPPTVTSTQPPCWGSVEVQRALQESHKIAMSHDPLHPTFRGRLFFSDAAVRFSEPTEPEPNPEPNHFEPN
ncbi:hypothetical protein FRC03_003682 [Tulasnella sp. 419]|nr:hypothetical protein FRC03_003682 [Tulasnella sp. 419]